MKAVRKPRKHPEQDLQISIVALANLIRPAVPFFHVPNGGARTKVEAAVFKRMGVRAGVTDLVFPRPSGQIGWMELKKDAKAKATDAQQAFALALTLMGHEVWLVSDIDRAREALWRWYEPYGYMVPRVLPGGGFLSPLLWTEKFLR